MGSMVEVLHAFPYAMIGGDTHPSPQAPPTSHRSTPLRPSHPDTPSALASSNLQPMPSGAVDAAMADVISRPPASTEPSFRPHALPPSGGVALAPPPGLAVSQNSLRPPASPRFGGHRSIPTLPGQAVAPGSSGPQALTSSSTVSSVQNSPARSATTQSPPVMPSPPRIKVKSLSHIQSFVIDDMNPLSPTRSSLHSPRGGRDLSPQYEISEMPVADIIEMVAGLLTKITTTNDRQHEYLHRQIPPADGTAGLSQQTTSVLAFHGKNVPSISILSYLSRIHKYCPTTYEVFLSLLVYFDRMTERVNSGPIQSLRQANQQSLERHAAASEGSRHSSISSAHLAHDAPVIQAATPPPSGSLGKPAETPMSAQQDSPPSPSMAINPPSDPDTSNLSHFFVVDSFNIHRLVIAGVTCASKFFSDIFYTNSRYAKVGGLPLPELNHLELQFLLLNDFRLAVPLEEMEAYGTMLVEFYAREVLAQQHPSSSIHSSHSHQGPPTVAT